MEKLPIIYVRGYAGATSGINGQVDDPFYGFNHGATHVRVNGDGDPMYYQFEGPLLRLMVDEGYQLKVHGDQLNLLDDAAAHSLNPDEIWVYRFYDQAATTFAAPPHENLAQRFLHGLKQHVTADGFDVTKAADGLYDLIELVLSRTKFADGQPNKVYLVAHSMGGLICRSMMQRTCLNEDDQGQQRRTAKDIVAKLFTYGTPHGGITFAIPGGTWFEQTFGPAGADIFAPHKMYGYLTKGGHFGDLPPDKDWDPQVMPADVFDTQDIFCVVGTDPADYGLLPRTAVGARSDGLVQIEHAYVVGAPRAYIHKSHSGPYGEVNSEEGYQNLRRFLFGKWQVMASFRGLTPVAQGAGEIGSWQADVRLAIRGNSVLMSEQSAAHWCPVLLNEEAKKPLQDDGSNAPVPLIATYLLDPSALPDGQDVHAGRARYALTLKVYKVPDAKGSFDFTDHLEGVAAWQDTLVVDVGPNADRTGLAAVAAWSSELKMADLPDDLTTSAAAHPFALNGAAGEALLPLPAAALALPILGPDGKLALSVTTRA